MLFLVYFYFHYFLFYSDLFFIWSLNLIFLTFYSQMISLLSQFFLNPSLNDPRFQRQASSHVIFVAILLIVFVTLIFIFQWCPSRQLFYSFSIFYYLIRPSASKYYNLIIFKIINHWTVRSLWKYITSCFNLSPLHRCSIKCPYIIHVNRF